VAAEWTLAAVAIVLTAAVLIGQMLGGRGLGPPEPGPRDGPAAGGPRATRPPAAAPTTAPGASSAATGPAAAGNLVPDPGFEAGMAGWLAIGGARVERTGPARAGRWAGGFTATGPGDQGMALAAVLQCTPGRTYAASLWIRASRPGTLVQVTLLEVAGGRRLAADSIGAVLEDQGWRRVEVSHDAHRRGAALAVEVVLPRGSPPAAVLVDDLVVLSEPGPMLPGG
jgi:hypothetical protein